jgi:hypothetical protein
METLVRPTRGARILTSREPVAQGALETMVQAIYVRRFPVTTEMATAEAAAAASKPRNVRPRKPRNAGRQK